VVGHPCARAPLLGNPKDEVFERYAKCHVNGPLSPVGEPGGGCLPGFLTEKKSISRLLSCTRRN